MVKVQDFVSVLQAGFDRHSISSRVYQGSLPNSCEYQLTYTARRSWDFAPYLAYAEIRLSQQGRVVGKVDYDHNNGFSLVKWAGTESKIGPLLDDMLNNFSADKRPPVVAPAEAAPVATAAAQPVASDAPPAGAPKLGRYQFQAEQLARGKQCQDLALGAQSPGVEIYTMLCGSMPASVKCLWGECAIQ